MTDPPARLMCLGDCGYALTTPLARARGYGHRCWARLPAAVQAAISLRVPARPRARRAPTTRPTGPAGPGQLEITDPTEETRPMPDPTPPTTPADDAAEAVAAYLDAIDECRFHNEPEIIAHHRLAGGGQVAVTDVHLSALLAERDQLRRQLDAADSADRDCDHGTAAMTALERLHARIHRDLPNDGSELAPPEDEFWARQLDALLAFADEVYWAVADQQPHDGHQDAPGAPQSPEPKSDSHSSSNGPQRGADDVEEEPRG